MVTELTDTLFYCLDIFEGHGKEQARSGFKYIYIYIYITNVNVKYRYVDMALGRYIDNAKPCRFLFVHYAILISIELSRTIFHLNPQ